jgi:hypothetical protein
MLTTRIRWVSSSMTMLRNYQVKVMLLRLLECWLTCRFQKSGSTFRIMTILFIRSVKPTSSLTANKQWYNNSNNNENSRCSFKQ